MNVTGATDYQQRPTGDDAVSEQPATCERLIAELYGWPWDSRYDYRAEVEPAIRAVLRERDGLVEFCDQMRVWHDGTDEGSGRGSWRDFRGMVVQDAFDDSFDRDRLFYEIEGRIRAEDA